MTEYVVIIALLAIIALFSVFVLGKEVRCVIEDAAISLGSDMTGHCVADAGTGSESGETSGPSEPSTPPPPPIPAPVVSFDDVNITNSEASNISITVTTLEPGDDISLLLSQGPNSITLTATSSAFTHQFTGVDLTGFSRGSVTAVVTRTRSGEDADSAPAMASLNFDLILEPDTPVAGNSFGLEIVMTSNRVFVGAPHENSVGRVYAFDRATGAQLFTIDPDPLRSVNQFGMIMAVGNNHLAITSQETTAGEDFVTVYDLNGNALYDVDEDPATPNENYFGREIQIVGNTLLVGDQLHVWGVGNSGAIHAFDLNNNGALLWSAQDSAYAGSGSRFDANSSILIGTNWSQNGITVWDMSDGSLISRHNASGSQSTHIEMVDGYMLYGDNAAASTRVYNVDPYLYQGVFSLDNPPSHSTLNLYEEAEGYVLINTGGSGDYDIELFNLASLSVMHTYSLPFALGTYRPQWGAGMAYEGGEVAIGAPAHDPLYDGNRTGVVYILPVP